MVLYLEGLMAILLNYHILKKHEERIWIFFYLK